MNAIPIFLDSYVSNLLQQAGVKNSVDIMQKNNLLAPLKNHVMYRTLAYFKNAIQSTTSKEALYKKANESAWQQLNDDNSRREHDINAIKILLQLLKKMS